MSRRATSSLFVEQIFIWFFCSFRVHFSFWLNFISMLFFSLCNCENGSAVYVTKRIAHQQPMAGNDIFPLKLNLIFCQKGNKKVHHKIFQREKLFDLIFTFIASHLWPLTWQHQMLLKRTLFSTFCSCQTRRKHGHVRFTDSYLTLRLYFSSFVLEHATTFNFVRVSQSTHWT